MSRTEELSKLVEEARNNVNQNNVGGDDSSKTYQFGSSFGLGDQYWSEKQTPKIDTGISFISDAFIK